MSRTDKTAPVGVKVTYRHEYLEAEHNHSNGACTLPDRPTGRWVDKNTPRERNAAGFLIRKGCRWVPSITYWRSGIARCGCSWCDGDAWAPRRRKERRAARAYARDGWRDEY